MALRLRLAQAGGYLLHGDMRTLMRRAMTLIYSDTIGIGVRKDLIALPDARETRADRRIRPATVDDVLAVLHPDRGKATDADEAWQRRLRRHVVERLGVDRCYVADSGDRGPSFMQYLFFAADNDFMRSALPGSSPLVAPDEAFLEFLYVAPDARTMPFLTGCMDEVAQEARRRGVDSIFTYLRPDATAMMLACQVGGFRIDSVRRSKHRLFRQTITYEPRPEDMPEAPAELLRHRSRARHTKE